MNKNKKNKGKMSEREKEVLSRLKGILDAQKINKIKNNEIGRRAKSAKSRSKKNNQGQGISECAHCYAAAVVDPWSIEGEGACVPVDVPGPSWKVKSFQTVTCALGTAGVGFIAIAPTVVNDKYAITYSTSAYTGTTISNDPSGTTTGVVGGKFTTLPVSYADVVTNNVAQGRVVVAGIRAKYTGSPLYSTGSMYIIGDSNRRLLAGLGASDISSENIARIKGVSRIQHTLIQTNNNATEREYSDELHFSTPLQVYPFGGANGTVDTAPPMTMGILFVGATTSVGQTFQVDLMLRVEYTGLKAAPSMTPSHQDSEGYSLVRDALDQMSTVKKSSNDSDSSIFNSLFKRVKKAVKMVSPYLMDFAKSASAAFLPPGVTRGMQALNYM